MIVRTSFTLPPTAEKGTNRAFVIAATIRASVVFPVPGGPQSINDGTSSETIAVWSGEPGPTTSC